MKTYSQFINEGVRDEMTPKPIEDIKNKLEGKPFAYVNHKLKQHSLKIDDLFTKEEIDKMDKNAFSYVDDDTEYVYIDTERMEEVLIGVGEGIDDISVSTNQYYPNEYQNEVCVIFRDNAWGGISLKEWNRLDEILKGLIKKNGLDYYDIDTNSARLTLRFDSKYPLEEL